MMKSKEEKVMLNLNLPLIEIEAPDVYNVEHYSESGCYFVKTKDGAIYVVDVDVEK